MQSPEQLLLDLRDPARRANALFKLVEERRRIQNMGPLLWDSFGTITVLLQGSARLFFGRTYSLKLLEIPKALTLFLEIVSVYPLLSPPSITPEQSSRVCNALVLLQHVASHPDTRMLFLKAQIPMYLYPFLKTTSSSIPIEKLRLSSLGAIGALMKVDDTQVTNFLLSSEIIPLCLQTMDVGAELSKTVATYILLKILLDGVGLEYICHAPDRFFAVTNMLRCMVDAFTQESSPRLLNYIIKCYLRLSEDQRGCDALRTCLPPLFKDAGFASIFLEDPPTKRCLQQLLRNIQVPHVLVQPGVGFKHAYDQSMNSNAIFNLS